MPAAPKPVPNRFQPMGKEPALPQEAAGSPGKVVIWVVIVIVLAVAAYLALRNVLKGPDTGSVTPTVAPTVEVSLEDKLYAKEVLDDELAEGKKEDSAFVLTDQTVGKASEAEYAILGLMVQRYTSFTRVQFTVANIGDTGEVFPLTTSVYDSGNKLLTLTMNSISNDDSGLGYYDNINLDTSVLSTLTHDGDTSNKVEKYVLKMKDNLGYVLQVLTTTTGENLVILDVKEQVEVIDTTPTATQPLTSIVVPTTPSASQQTTDLETQFSKGAQEINTGTTGNNTQVARYNYADGVQLFTWNLYLNVGKDKYPNVKGRIEDNKLIIEVSNYSKTSSPVSTINFSSVKDISKVDVSVTDHVAKYEFYLSKPMEYRMLFVEADNILRFEVKH